jgi:hypothetical protein
MRTAEIFVAHLVFNQIYKLLRFLAVFFWIGLLGVPAFAVTIVTAGGNLAPGTAGSAYLAAIEANNGCYPYAWKIVSGSLPPGLWTSPSKSPITRRFTQYLDITGTPTEAGSYTFTVEVIGCERGHSERTFTIVIGEGSGTTSSSVSSVSLNWDANASSEDVASYNVMRGTTSGGPFVQIGTSTTTSYTDSTVQAGTTYYYVVQAVNASGPSGNSNEAGAVIPSE